MFGFGLQKLLLLAVLIGGVWYGFKYFGRLDAARKKVEKAARAAADKVVDSISDTPPTTTTTQDMERCETCGDFVAAGSATSCGREACPYLG
ncbi:MAG: hypothetical protein VCD50_14740 [Alphaproteobacteria bacterium]